MKTILKICLNCNKEFNAPCSYSNIKGLVVHHIDRNRENNELDNLEILYACCHMIDIIKTNLF